MKKLSKIKIEKLLDNHRKGVPIEANARQLKIERNTAKKYLRENGFLGSSVHLPATYLTPSLQQDQGISMAQPSRSNQHYSTPVYYDTSITDPTELQYLREENKKVEKNCDDLTTNLGEVINKFVNLVEEYIEKNKELEQFKQNNTELITINKELTKKITKHEQSLGTQKEQHQRELNEQKTRYDQDLTTIKQQHQLELDGQKTTHNQEMWTMKQQYEHELISQQKHNEGLTDNLNSVSEEYKDLTERYAKLKDEKQRLQEKQKGSGIKYGIAFIAGAGTGALGYHMISEALKNKTIPQTTYRINMNKAVPQANYGKNTNAGYAATPIQQSGIIQPDVHNTHSGVNLGTNTTGTL